MPVAARYQDLRDRVAAAVDKRFAEPVRLSPMAGGRLDSDRPQIVIEAPLRVGEGKETNAGGGSTSSWRSRLSAGRGELHIDRTKYPTLRIVPGDKVRAIARAGEPLFEVLTVDDRSHTRFVLELGEA